MISVKRCTATNISTNGHHHPHHNPHGNSPSHHHHNQHHRQNGTVQVRSSSAGRAGSNSGSSGGCGSNNNNRLIRSRNSPSLGATNGYSSGGFPGGGPATVAASLTNGGSYSIITNGGSLYYSTSNNSIAGPKSLGSEGPVSKTVVAAAASTGADIFELDSLFLVPKCALTYDKAMSLRKDLAAYDFNIRILEDTPKGNVWISGNRDATIQKQSRPSSANKDTRPHSMHLHTLHWFACVGEDYDSNGYGNEEDLQKEREERIKQIKERQNEERQRKLEEIKAQALATQKYREQKEEERRRRMEDLRRRENDRRSQAEERRRAIQEADNERRQYILQRNQERDQRMESKRRNERSSIQFAFGSSTPRMIDTTDSGMCSSFWANRRATSITNVAYTGAPLTRRSSERELTDGSSKKRATSASGLDRSTDGRAFSMTRLDQLAQPRRRNGEHISAIIERERRQAHELENLTRLSLSSSRASPTADGGASSKRMSRSMSQLASPSSSKYRHPSQESPHSAGRPGRKSSFNSSLGDSMMMGAGRLDTSKSMSQLNTAGRVSRLTKTERLRQQVREQLNGSASTGASSSTTATGLRSGEITPNSLNTSRPGSAMSNSTTASGVVYRRSLPHSAGSHQQRKQRPVSIAVTGVSAGPKEEKPPLPKISATNNSSSTSLERKRSQSGTSTPSRPITAPDSATPKKHHTPMERQRLGSGTSSVRGTPKASSTPLQSPGPEKANRTLQDSLQKQKKQPSVVDDHSQQQHQQQPQQLLPQQQPPLLAKEGSSVSAKSSNEEKVEVVQQEQQKQEEVVVQSNEVITVVETVEQQQQVVVVSETKVAEEVQPEEEKVEQPPQVMEVSSHEEKKDEMKESTIASNKLEPNPTLDGSNADLMTASMIAKRINTEEEAKAALAERRRLAREEAERLAELERQRIAAEEEAELQRQLEEEERLRKLEEETIRLAEEQRRLEEERLHQAIQDAQKREEEERQRREEEARQKVEREEAEKKAREEAERQRIEMAERLKKEEKEREERRKRVEAIMSRTRTKGSANNTPTKQSDENKDNAMSKSVIVTSSTASTMLDQTMSMTESMLGSIEQQQQPTEDAEAAAQTIEEKTESLAQSLQSLSLTATEGNQQNQENNNSSSNSSNDSSLISNNHNNNVNSGFTTTAASSNNATDYERSVTEKENLLLGSFNNNLKNSNATSNGGSDNGSSLQPSLVESSSTPAAAHVNGKSTNAGDATTIAETTELIIEDAIMSGQTNGHKNGSIDNVFTQNTPAVDGSAKFLAHFDTQPLDFALSSAADGVESSDNHNQLDSTTSTSTSTTTTTGTTVVGQLIEFSSFQSLPDEAQQQQQQQQTISDNDDPFNLNLDNNNSLPAVDGSSSHVELLESSSNGTSNPFSNSLFTSSDANLISNSNFLNNNSTRLVATSDSQDNRDLSLL
ncbi:J domain-containing protein DDB_G0295729 isoform X5 [Armigeres subalbatus]|uniref:J domain-containing protein DDB_G0295729 isoform X5 n=1 Tax=Armigeres subalbatus TaxID=124917 RepID=UPI002ED5108B